MLTANGLSMTIGARILFENVSFVVNDRDRIGLVGRNGSGKSTLVRILAGLERPSVGSVATRDGTRVGYLAQGALELTGLTVGAEMRSGIAGLHEARERVERLAAHLTSAADVHSAASEYAEALAAYEALGGYPTDEGIERALRAVGLDGLALGTPMGRLSGGQQTRVGIATLLMAEPDLMLLDEPTNHLDIEGLEWLEGFVRGFAGGVLVVSHDREFLNRCVTQIVYLDDEAQKAQVYTGDYDESVAQREAEAERAMAVYRDQQAEIRRIELDIRQTREQANRTERATTHDYLRGRAKKVARKAKARETRLQRYIESEERVEKPRGRWEMKIDFSGLPRGAQFAVRMVNASFSYGDQPVLAGCSLEVQHGEKIAVLGPNGSGKTTLLRMMAGELEPAGGSVRIGEGIQAGHLRQDQLDLEAGATPLSVIQRAGGYDETAARTYLHYFLFSGDESLTAVEKLSFGERLRLSMAALIVRGANMLLLDEPMNHLDIPSRERLEAALEQFPGPLVAVTHDRAFVRRFATGIWWLEPGNGGFTPRVCAGLDEIEPHVAEVRLTD